MYVVGVLVVCFQRKCQMIIFRSSNQSIVLEIVSSSLGIAMQPIRSNNVPTKCVPIQYIRCVCVFCEWMGCSHVPHQNNAKRRYKRSTSQKWTQNVNIFLKHFERWKSRNCVCVCVFVLIFVPFWTMTTAASVIMANCAFFYANDQQQ